MHVVHSIIEVAGPDDLSSLVEATMTASATYFLRFLQLFCFAIHRSRPSGLAQLQVAIFKLNDLSISNL